MPKALCVVGMVVAALLLLFFGLDLGLWNSFPRRQPDCGHRFHCLLGDLGLPELVDLARANLAPV